MQLERLGVVKVIEHRVDDFFGAEQGLFDGQPVRVQGQEHVGQHLVGPVENEHRRARRIAQVGGEFGERLN